jgi:hypothetical protein
MSKSRELMMDDVDLGERAHNLVKDSSIFGILDKNAS